ncbi:Flp pilus assembly protein TadG [Amycolatopsis bartoniae]|uniref:Pilus assembly protein n=1 Tax=Amycolatopsis bartoniae TaxID=941986 RepID=A0A8H9MFU7_9PSEU|nr:TadE family type IV pilus minor pilin [Amycolatopsis bartoniae]MBB2935170.1 Flp pilus assembly protein TadG [Amycolatopsis bartoniae]TVT07039.1 pilus assembly protein [Amycolatopsis bartoniae]GHF74859.1 hypothetical protein GCM10017566_55880 [Amycolatopsis bartoniae]
MTPPARAESDRGAVTVEAAIGLGVLAIMFSLVLAGVFMASWQLRCVDAAQEAARLAARGDQAGADQAVDSLAPPGARLAIQTSGEQITTDVTASPPGGLLPGITLRGHAYALVEPEVSDASG